MKFENLSDLPDWEDNKFDHEDIAGEEWKANPTRQACKKLYLQWQQVIMMLNGAIQTMQVAPEEYNDSTVSFPKEYWDDCTQMIIHDGYEVAAKLRSSESGLYIIRMENASIIRKNSQGIYSALLTMSIENVLDEAYVNAISTEIDVFRDLYKHWVSTFKKDEHIDEWGLYI